MISSSSLRSGSGFGICERISFVLSNQSSSKIGYISRFINQDKAFISKENKSGFGIFIVSKSILFITIAAPHIHLFLDQSSVSKMNSVELNKSRISVSFSLVTSIQI